MPGQTEFALCLHGRIDGRKVAFTGDNLFGDTDDPTQTGHEAMVAHNSAILEEGYIYGAEYLSRLQPDILVGGHSFVMDHPAKFIERYRRWSYQMRDAFQGLSADDAYPYMFDPFWVHAEPYRVALSRGESVDVTLRVRNFQKTTQTHRIELHTPPGIIARPSILDGEIPGAARQSFPIRIEAAGDAAEGVHIVALDITIDGRRLGEWFDFVVGVRRSEPGERASRGTPYPATRLGIDLAPGGTSPRESCEWRPCPFAAHACPKTQWTLPLPASKISAVALSLSTWSARRGRRRSGPRPGRRRS